MSGGVVTQRPAALTIVAMIAPLVVLAVHGLGLDTVLWGNRLPSRVVGRSIARLGLRLVSLLSLLAAAIPTVAALGTIGLIAIRLLLVWAVVRHVSGLVAHATDHLATNRSK